jgi:outer membrane protein
MKRKLFILLMTTLWIPAIMGQQVNVWSFQQCLDTALKRNITINQSRLSNEIARINLEQSKASRYPNLNANAAENANLGKSINPLTNLVVFENYNSTAFSVNSSMNLFNGLQTRRTIEQNLLLLNAGKYDTEQAKNDVTVNVTTAYLQVLFSYEILDAAKSQAEATKVQVDQTEKLVNAGKVPEGNLFTIRAQQATDNLAVVNAQSQLDLAKLALEQLMQIPVADSFDIKKPEPGEPEAILLQTNDQIYQKALTVQPQIAGASIRTNSALLGIKITEGARWPRLSLSGNMNSNFSVSTNLAGGSSSGSSPFFYQLWDNLGGGLGVGLSIPIYSNRQIKSGIDKAKVNALSAQLDEENTRLQLRKIIEQAYTDLRSSINKYAASKEQVKSAELAYKNVEKKYNVGLSTAIDYLIQKNIFFQAESNLIQSKYDFIFKAKILDFYQGKPIIM